MRLKPRSILYSVLTAEKFVDFRHTVGFELQKRIAKNPRYSLRTMANNIGISASTLSLVFTRMRCIIPRFVSNMMFDRATIFYMKNISLIAFLTLVLPISIAFADVNINLKCLWSAYKNFKISPDGRDILFANRKILPFESRTPNIIPDRNSLNSADQMFLQPYPAGFFTDAQGKKSYEIPTANEDLRDSHYTALFMELYGHAPSEVIPNLAHVRWIDGSMMTFNRNYGAAHALEVVSKQLQILLRAHPEYLKFLKSPIGGTYQWRPVAGVNNLSLHSFGIAIDINTKFSDYWRWEMGPDQQIHYHNQIPLDIVEIFENNGFTWGGKWYHYDTMHFEYRPELILTAEFCNKEFEKYIP